MTQDQLNERAYFLATKLDKLDWQDLADWNTAWRWLAEALREVAAAVYEDAARQVRDWETPPPMGWIHADMTVPGAVKTQIAQVLLAEAERLRRPFLWPNASDAARGPRETSPHEE